MITRLPAFLAIAKDSDRAIAILKVRACQDLKMKYKIEIS
jgi:hypothetical protein